MQLQHNKHPQTLLWLLFALALAPFIWAMINISVNANQAWWLIAARRWLAGGDMLHDFYDTNPPWVVIYYAAQVLMTQITGLPIYYEPVIFGFAFLGLSVTAIYFCLKKFPFLSAAERTAVLIAYAAANTLAATTYFFGDRDHMVVMALTPLLLAQLAITYAYPASKKLLWPIIFVSGFFILFKPHFMIFPAALILHRFAIRRRLNSAIRDPDFLILSGWVILYAISMLTVFRAFTFLIAPDSFHLYENVPDASMRKQSASYALVILMFALAAHFLNFDPARKKILYALYAAALTCVFFFFIQMKGFYYHLIPALSFFYISLALFMFYALETWIKNARARLWFITAFILAFTYMKIPVYSFPTHDQMRNLPLPAMLKSCAPDCSYFLISETMDFVNEGPLYIGSENASRFPGLWWMPEIARRMKEHPDPADPEHIKYKALQLKYAGMVAQDMTRFHPDYMFVITDLTIAQQKNFDIVKFLSISPAFQKVMKRYEKTGAYKDSPKNYMQNTDADPLFPYIFDVYTLKGYAGKKMKAPMLIADKNQP